jgi:hypothetical protein
MLISWFETAQERLLTMRSHAASVFSTSLIQYEVP